LLHLDIEGLVAVLIELEGEGRAGGGLRWWDEGEALGPRDLLLLLTATCHQFNQQRLNKPGFKFSPM
jgi:hypothetical protein